MKKRWVKSYNPDGSCSYFPSLEETCRVFGIRYHESLKELIDKGGLAPDGRTFFDYPTDQEIKELEKRYGYLNQQRNSNTDKSRIPSVEKSHGSRDKVCGLCQEVQS